MRTYFIATPFPRSILAKKLKENFPNSISGICDDPKNEGFETCYFIGMNVDLFVEINEQIGDVIIFNSDLSETKIDQDYDKK